MHYLWPLTSYQIALQTSSNVSGYFWWCEPHIVSSDWNRIIHLLPYHQLYQSSYQTGLGPLLLSIYWKGRELIKLVRCIICACLDVMLSGGWQSLSWSGCGRLVWVQEVGLLRQAMAREERGRKEGAAHLHTLLRVLHCGQFLTVKIFRLRSPQLSCGHFIFAASNKCFKEDNVCVEGLHLSVFGSKD